MLLAPAVAHLVLAVPIFKILQVGTLASVFTGTIVLAAIMAPFIAVSISAMAEDFPTTVRATGISLSFNFTIAIFGGMAPFAATWLIGKTGSVTSPAWYLMFAALVSLVGLAVWRQDQGGELAADSETREEISVLPGRR